MDLILGGDRADSRKRGGQIVDPHRLAQVIICMSRIAKR